MVFTLISCECVPDITTPKETEPEFYSRVLFFNLMSETTTLNLSNNGRLLSSAFTNSQTNNFYLYKISAGLSTISLSDTKDSIRYRNILKLDTNAYYTAIFTGKNTEISGMILSDTISGYSNSNVYIRFVNASAKYNDLVFELKGYSGTTTKSCTILQATAPEPLYSGTFTLTVYDKGIKQAEKTDIVLSAGRMYNFVFAEDGNNKAGIFIAGYSR